MATKPHRVAIYLRVSREDQEPENQLIQLREFCERWEDHELVAEYVDRESGTRGRRERKDFDRRWMPGWLRSVGSGPLTWMLSNATSTA